MKLNSLFRWCRFAALAALVAGGVRWSFASPAPESTSMNELTLAAAIEMAVAGNPELRASRGRVDAAAGRTYQAKQGSNPELELNAEDWPVSGGSGCSDAKQTIGIAQTLPFPGKKSLDRRMSGAGVKLSEAELAVCRTELVRDVKAGFFRVLASERLLEVSTQLVAVAESSAATARKRVDAQAAAYQGWSCFRGAVAPPHPGPDTYLSSVLSPFLRRGERKKDARRSCAPPASKSPGPWRSAWAAS